MEKLEKKTMKNSEKNTIKIQLAGDTESLDVCRKKH